MGYRIAYVQGGCAVLHEVDDVLTEVRTGIPQGKVLTEWEAKAYKALLEKKGLGTPFGDMVRFTSIVLCFEGVVHSVRAHNCWMGDDEVGAYLEGLELAKEGTNVVFNRIALGADIGDSDGGWVSAHLRNGKWDLASGGGYNGARA